MALPRIFAIFVEESYSGYMRYALIETQTSPDHFRTTFYLKPVRDAVDIKLTLQNRPIPAEVRTAYILVTNASTPAPFKFWYTSWWVKRTCDADWIPVLDFEVQYPCPIPAIFHVDQDEWIPMFNRVRNQRRLREENLAPPPTTFLSRFFRSSPAQAPPPSAPLDSPVRPVSPPHAATPPRAATPTDPAAPPEPGGRRRRRPTPVPTLDFDVADTAILPTFSRSSMLIVAQPRVTQAPQAHPRIPKHVVEALKRDAVAKGDSCPISMEDFTASSSLAVTSCFHLFQEEALTTWLQSNTSCPLCKDSVTFTVKA